MIKKRKKICRFLIDCIKNRKFKCKNWNFRFSRKLINLIRKLFNLLIIVKFNNWLKIDHKS